MTFVNFDKDYVKRGPVNFNYQTKERDLVGAFTGSSTLGNIQELSGDYSCFRTTDFAKIILPALKKGHDDYWNWKDVNNTLDQTKNSF